jgi:calmodulin
MAKRLDPQQQAKLVERKAKQQEEVNKFKATLNAEQVSMYRKHFEMFDLNGDGVISARELRKVSRQMGYRLQDSQIEAIIKENDLDANGCLSFDEFLLSMAANLKVLSDDEHRRADVRRKFAEFDKDGNGIVTVGEAHEILQRELGFTSSQSAELVARYDINGDGQLDYEEFVHFYAKVKAKIDKIREMFEEFDADKNGAVSLAEVSPALKRLGFSDKDIQALITRHDKNKDGELQYDEFVSFLWAS